jgi:hypothetical protein
LHRGAAWLLPVAGTTRGALVPGIALSQAPELVHFAV